MQYRYNGLYRSVVVIFTKVAQGYDLVEIEYQRISLSSVSISCIQEVFQPSSGGGTDRLLMLRLRTFSALDFSNVVIVVERLSATMTDQNTAPSSHRESKAFSSGHDAILQEINGDPYAFSSNSKPGRHSLAPKIHHFTNIEQIVIDFGSKFAWSLGLVVSAIVDLSKAFPALNNEPLLERFQFIELGLGVLLCAAVPTLADAVELTRFGLVGLNFSSPVLGGMPRVPKTSARHASLFSSPCFRPVLETRGTHSRRAVAAMELRILVKEIESWMAFGGRNATHTIISVKEIESWMTVEILSTGALTLGAGSREFLNQNIKCPNQNKKHLSQNPKRHSPLRKEDVSRMRWEQGLQLREQGIQLQNGDPAALKVHQSR
ncbi:hypothetical protein B0H63DRAFT_453008 [Podospora didyma]|uniref:Uncharacterized protein n=1 Tax=Podospora didyma TaxID=330526 RepID=A0AAE0KFE7_9PEZI|nr:hypothetical protein B0H63DRAFT_453008 [Podospora didyma]